MLFVFGLLFGSFVAAWSWRYPRKISNVSGRSFCDFCKKELRWYDNIPLISYLFLAGKCRSCGKRISIRYPIIELITALGFVLIGFNILYLLLFLILELIFIIDFENQIIPDQLVFYGILLAIFTLNGQLYNPLFAGFLAALFLLMIHIITKGRGMGLGDVKFAILAGMIIDIKLLGIWMLLSFLTGGIVGIILILSKWAKLKDKIAFGPFLIISIPITLIWGEKIITLLF